MAGLDRSLAGACAIGAAAALLVLACASEPRGIEYDARGDLPVTADGLHRIHSTRLGAVYLRPGARFGDYDAILIDPVRISYKRPPRKATSSNRQRGNFELSASDMDRLEGMFQQTFEAEFARSEVFALAEQPAPNVLRVSGQIVDLVVNAAPARGSDMSFSVSAGEMTLILDVRGSETGEPLARASDRRAIRPASGGANSLYYSNPTRNWGEVERRFRAWAGILREGLDELRDLPEVPLPE